MRKHIPALTSLRFLAAHVAHRGVGVVLHRPRRLGFPLQVAERGEALGLGVIAPDRGAGIARGQVREGVRFAMEDMSEIRNLVVRRT
jgi:hypothetical protein